MQKSDSVEFLEFKPSEHEDAETTTETSCACTPDETDARLRAKIDSLEGSLYWWTLVPKAFLCLILFCFGFALLSLVGIAIMAERSSSDAPPSPPNSISSSSSGSHGTDDDTSSDLLLGIGVISSVVGSLQTACGYCAQRLGHLLRELMADHPRFKTQSQSITRTLLFIGLLLLICGTIAAVVNLGILGQSVTAPFAAMTLIFNGCLAFLVLHEHVTNYDIIATVLVLLGVGVAMLGVGMADLGVQEFVLADIEAILLRSCFPLVYSVVVLGSLMALYVFVTRRKLECQSPGLCLFSIGAGVLSGFSSLCVKCTVEVIKGAAQQHSGDLTNPVLYLFVLGIPLCVLSQLKLMTMGLQYFGTLKFVPPYHAFIILSNLVNGMVYFDESKGYDAVSASLFMVGCVVTVAGVFVLLMKAPHGGAVSVEKPVKPGAPANSNDSSTASSSDSDSEQTSDAKRVTLAPPVMRLPCRGDDEDDDHVV